jgi:hypothetical protein
MRVPLEVSDGIMDNLDACYWLLVTGHWLLDTRCSILDFFFRIPISDFCFRSSDFCHLSYFGSEKVDRIDLYIQQLGNLSFSSDAFGTAGHRGDDTNIQVFSDLSHG